MARCKDWNVVVTGASSGIGRALAIAFGHEGACVWMGGRDMHELETTGKFVMAEGGTAFAVPLDVTDERSVAAFAQRVGRDAPGVDVLINNAGVGAWGQIDSLDAATWRRVIDTNLTGPFLVTKALLPLLRQREGRRRHIINVVSVAGKTGFPGSGAYSASKFGLRGWTEALAQELAPEGIRVTGLLPGYVATPLVRSSAEPKDMVQPEELARVVVDLTQQPESLHVDELVVWPWRMYAD